MAFHKRTIFFLIGPTASGKTNLAVDLVKTFPFEIISVDSAQIYQDMNIGVAKPSKNVLEIAPHHLINIIKPNEAYSVAQFTHDSLKLINEMGTDTNVFVISHKGDQLFDKFRSVIKFEKKNNFSRIAK